MGRKVIIGSVAAIAIILFGLASMKMLGKTEEKKSKPTISYVQSVQIKKVKYSSQQTTVEANGRLVASREIDIIAEANGKIYRGSIDLKEGAQFNKGDVICTIYKDEVSLALKAQKSQFLNQIASILPDIKIDYPEEYSKYKSYFDQISIDNDLPDLPKYDVKLKVFLASRNILTQYYSIKQAELSVKRHTIYAPFNGSVKTVSMQEGAFANVGARIARIMSTDVLELEVPVDNANSKWVKKGQVVTVSSPSRELQWKGQVARISNYVDERTQARSIFVSLNANSNLLVGEYLTANFDGSRIANAMEIPRNAIHNFNNVYIVENDTLKSEQVNIIKNNNTTILINGLKEGTQVVVEPLINAQVGTYVNTINKE